MGGVRVGELFPMRLLGFGLYLAWTSFVAPFEKAHGVEAFSSSIVRLYVYVALTAALYVAAAWYVSSSGRSPWGRWSVVLCTAAGVLWPACEFAALAVPAGGAVLDLVSIVLRSVSCVGFFLMWNVQLAGHKARTAWIAYAGSFAVAACVYLVVSAFGMGAVTAALFGLPACSGVLLVMSRCLLCEDADAHEEGSVTWHFPWRPVILMALFSFSYSLAGHFDGDLHEAGELGRLVVAAVVLLCAVFAFDRFDAGVIYKVCPAFMVAGLFLCSAGGLDDVGLRGLLVSVGYNGFTLYMYLVLNTVCYRFGAPAEWLFGITEAVCIVAAVPSSTLGNWLSIEAGRLPWAPELAMGIAIVAVVLLSMLLLTTRTSVATWGIKGVRSQGGGQVGEGGAPAARIETNGYLEDYVYRCARVARHYGLTHREEEVLSLLAQGKTFQEVEGALTIAHGTMRVHVQHIYAKLGVHGVEEAREVVEGWGR